MVCDVALPTVLGVLASEPGCVVADEPVFGEGTRLHLICGIRWRSRGACAPPSRRSTSDASGDRRAPIRRGRGARFNAIAPRGCEWAGGMDTRLGPRVSRFFRSEAG